MNGSTEAAAGATTSTLRVPGARLYYTTRGAGPVLLLIQGGAGDADAAGGLVDHLVTSYTVVTYDRRGQARSPIDDAARPIEIRTHSDDVHCLLAALTHEPAFVFGSSIGAVIGLDLAITWPQQVRTLVAHEPPLGQFVPDAQRANLRLSEQYRREGAAALKTFAAKIGLAQDGIGRQRELMSPANAQFFLERDAPAVGRYTLDPSVLKAVPAHVVVAGGRDGRAYFPYQCASRLASALGTPLVEFPGHHAGYVTMPERFAARLREVLGD